MSHDLDVFQSVFEHIIYRGPLAASVLNHRIDRSNVCNEKKKETIWKNFLVSRNLLFISSRKNNAYSCID